MDYFKETSRVQRAEALSAIQTGGEFLVQKAGTRKYQLARSISGKVVSIILEETPIGFVINPPSYTFRSKISFFDYCEDEQRWSRNKVIIEQTVRILKKTKLWVMIQNKDFFKVNEHNKKTASKEKAKELLCHIQTL
jgi:hypothetical protein